MKGSSSASSTSLSKDSGEGASAGGGGGAKKGCSSSALSQGKYWKKSASGYMYVIRIEREGGDEGERERRRTGHDMILRPFKSMVICCGRESATPDPI